MELNYSNMPKNFKRTKNESLSNVKNTTTSKKNIYNKRPIRKGMPSDSTKYREITNLSKNEYKENKIISNQNLIKSKSIICPICGQHSFINIKNYKINLYDCKNNHRTENVLLSEFMESQKKGLSNIKCDHCITNNKNNTDKNEFYYCQNCQMNLCPKCTYIHNKEHNIVIYELIYYICLQHNYNYMYFCNACKKNLCSLCLNEHKGHDIKSFQSLNERKDDIKREMM